MNGDGYYQPSFGTLEDIKYVFTVTISPCKIDILFKSNPIFQGVFEGGFMDIPVTDTSPEFDIKMFTFGQAPECNTVYELVYDLPDFLEANSDSVIQALPTDASHIGQYIINVSATVPTANDLGLAIDLESNEFYTLTVRVHPCEVTFINRDDINDITYNLGEPDVVIPYSFTYDCDSVYELEFELVTDLSVLTLDTVTSTLGFPSTLDYNLSGEH